MPKIQIRRAAALSACALLSAGAAGAQTAAAPRGELPLKHAAQPTTPAITAQDLMSRLYVFADDSMLGRRGGTAGNVKGTDYIAAEARRMGLRPAGENGTFFQTIPLVRRTPDPASTLSVDGQALAAGTDFALVVPYRRTFPFGTAASGQGLPVVYGGQLRGQVIDPAAAAGKVVVFGAPVDSAGRPDYRFWTGTGLDRFSGAAAIVIATLDVTTPATLGFVRQPRTLMLRPEAPRAVGVLVTSAVAERMLGAPLAGLQPGAAGRTVSLAMRMRDTPSEFPARNVVAVLPGSDPALRGEYVAIGAHNDHIGVQAAVVDHDSLRAYNTVMRPNGAEDPQGSPTPGQWARIRAGLDSLRRIHPARPDSIANGADDDGSGSVGVLEIAENLARAPRRPRRSILFVWHTGEELGLLGSEWFTDHPTVPRDSIVAQLNIDMIGRGRAEDLAGGGPSYLGLVGSRRLSTELGDLVETVNRGLRQPFTFDYQYDAPGHPVQVYCRSDHYEYARYGIPVTFFSTNGHRDYHQVTDEPQYIDYPHMAGVASFIRDVAVRVADLDHRVAVDHPKPDPNATCRQ
jgi:hypothetical protein